MPSYDRKVKYISRDLMDAAPAPPADGHRKNSPYSGRPLPISGALATRIKDSFGLDASQLSLRESPEVEEMGARAMAQGDSIRFAPGEFRPDSGEGLEVLGHELGHVVQQAKGGVRANVPGSNFNVDAGLEAAGDRMGSAFAAGSLCAAGPVPLSGVNAASAPAQGLFNIGKKKRSKKQKADSKAHLNQLRQMEENRREAGIFQAIMDTPLPESKANQSGAFIPFSDEFIASKSKGIGVGDGYRNGSGSGENQKDVITPFQEEFMDYLLDLRDRGILRDEDIVVAGSGAGIKSSDASHALSIKALQMLLPYMEQEGMQDYVKAVFQFAGGGDYTSSQHEFGMISNIVSTLPSRSFGAIPQLNTLNLKKDLTQEEMAKAAITGNIALRSLASAFAARVNDKDGLHLDGMDEKERMVVEAAQPIRQKIVQAGAAGIRPDRLNLLQGGKEWGEYHNSLLFQNKRNEARNPAPAEAGRQPDDAEIEAVVDLITDTAAETDGTGLEKEPPAAAPQAAAPQHTEPVGKRRVGWWENMKNQLRVAKLEGREQETASAIINKKLLNRELFARLCLNHVTARQDKQREARLFMLEKQQEYHAVRDRSESAKEQAGYQKGKGGLGRWVGKRLYHSGIGEDRLAEARSKITADYGITTYYDTAVANNGPTSRDTAGTTPEPKNVPRPRLSFADSIAIIADRIEPKNRAAGQRYKQYVDALLSYQSKDYNLEQADAFDIHHQIILSCLGGLVNNMLIYRSDPQEIKQARNAVYSTMNSLSLVIQEARQEYREAKGETEHKTGKWGDLLNRAATYINAIDITGASLENSSSGAISDVTKIQQDGKTHFFKTKQVILNSQQMMEKVLDKMTDSACKTWLCEIIKEKNGIDFLDGMHEQYVALNSEARSLLASTTTEAQSVELLQSAFNQGLHMNKLNSEALPATDTAFWGNLLQFFRMMEAESHTSWALYNNLQLGDELTKRNIATRRLADLLGVGDLIVHSRTGVLLDESGATKEGLIMDAAAGSNAPKKATGVTANFQRQLACLEVLDQLALQCDRHLWNYFRQYDEQGRADSLMGIDNDSAFPSRMIGQAFTGYYHLDELSDGGKPVPVTFGSMSKLQPFTGQSFTARYRTEPESLSDEEQTQKHIRLALMAERYGYDPKAIDDLTKLAIAPYIDADMAKRILLLTPDILYNAMADVLEPTAIRNLKERVWYMQQVIKNTQNEAEKNGSRYMLQPHEWNKHTFNEMAATKNDVPNSYYFHGFKKYCL